MNEFFRKLWKDEEGAETVEWVIIAAILAGIAVAAYQGSLLSAINNGVGFIEGQITSSATAPTP